jgi:hypothetical protein
MGLQVDGQVSLLSHGQLAALCVCCLMANVACFCVFMTVVPTEPQSQTRSDHV